MVVTGGLSFGLHTPLLTTVARRGGGPPSTSTIYGTTSLLIGNYGNVKKSQINAP
jgi:hypothetical protein